MTSQAIAGFTLGLAYAAPIGAQNLFVVSQALRLGSPLNFLLAAIVAIMDISLAIACMMGVGTILNEYTLLKALIGTIGGIYLIYIALDGLRAFQISSELLIEQRAFPWRIIVWKAFLLTWLNPHAIIDGSAILGTYSASLYGQDKFTFMTGVGAASICWFMSISTVAAYFNGKNGKAFINTIKVASSVTIAYFAISILSTSLNDWLRV